MSKACIKSLTTARHSTRHSMAGSAEPVIGVLHIRKLDRSLDKIIELIWAT